MRNGGREEGREGGRAWMSVQWMNERMREGRSEEWKGERVG